MSNELIGKPKWPIFNTLPRQNNGALIRNPTNQPHIPQHRLIFLKPERPSRSNKFGIIPTCQVTRKHLKSNRLREVDGVLNPIPRPRIDANKLGTLPNLDLLQNFQVLPLPPLLLKPSRMKGLHVGQSTPI